MLARTSCAPGPAMSISPPGWHSRYSSACIFCWADAADRYDANTRSSIVQDREVLHIAPARQSLQKCVDVCEVLLAHYSLGIGRHVARRIAQLLLEPEVWHDGLGE